jgi:hypothetical protein
MWLYEARIGDIGKGCKFFIVNALEKRGVGTPRVRCGMFKMKLRNIRFEWSLI